MKNYFFILLIVGSFFLTGCSSFDSCYNKCRDINWQNMSAESSCVDMQFFNLCRHKYNEDMNRFCYDECRKSVFVDDKTTFEIN